MRLENVTVAASTAVDCDKFRLRRFIEELDHRGELAYKAGTTPLSEVALTLEANPKAVLFEATGGFPLVGNVLASRTRFAAAFGVPAANLTVGQNCPRCQPSRRPVCRPHQLIPGRASWRPLELQRTPLDAWLWC